MSRKIGETWGTRQERYAFLDRAVAGSGIHWQPITTDVQNNWLTSDSAKSYTGFVALGTKAAKRTHATSESVIFHLFSLGVVSSRDAYAYNFSSANLQKAARTFVDAYDEALAIVQRKKVDPDSLIDVADARIKWTRQTKAALRRGAGSEFKPGAVRSAVYRPFTKTALYFDDFWNEEQYRFREIFPETNSERENVVLCASGPGAERPFASFACTQIPDLNFFGPGTVPQWFPFYTYAEDGTNRRENITDWALEQFRSHYADSSITKRDIFHYVYAMLHHPDYRERYAANLRRELPRIPFIGAQETAGMPAIFVPFDPSPAGPDDNSPGLRSRRSQNKENSSTLPKAIAGGQSPRATSDSADRPYPRLSEEEKTAALSEIKRMQDGGELVPTRLRYFRYFVKAGQRLADIHIHYELQPEYPLTKTEKAGEKLDYRVEKMKLTKDKTSLIYNRFLTLSGIPKETYDYRLGNRSALEWIVDQYQVSTDKRSGIVNDPNRADDPTYILRLIGQVITVSLETVKLVSALPPLQIQQSKSAPASTT
jgi:predicted helicase